MNKIKPNTPHTYEEFKELLKDDSNHSWIAAEITKHYYSDISINFDKEEIWFSHDEEDPLTAGSYVNEMTYSFKDTYVKLWKYVNYINVCDENTVKINGHCWIPIEPATWFDDMESVIEAVEKLQRENLDKRYQVIDYQNDCVIFGDTEDTAICKNYNTYIPTKSSEEFKPITVKISDTSENHPSHSTQQIWVRKTHDHFDLQVELNSLSARYTENYELYAELMVEGEIKKFYWKGLKKPTS